jgi:hypothetical protein
MEISDDNDVELRDAINLFNKFYLFARHNHNRIPASIMAVKDGSIFNSFRLAVGHSLDPVDRTKFFRSCGLSGQLSCNRR